MIECMYLVCTVTNWEVHLVLWTKYVMVCAEYIQVRTVFVPACTWYVHVHTCFYLYTSVVLGKAAAWRVLGMMPSLRKSATLEQSDTWWKERRLRLHRARLAHLVDLVNKLASEDKHVQTSMYWERTLYILVCTVFTKILQRMLFYVECLWETILCVRDMYAVVLQH